MSQFRNRLIFAARCAGLKKIETPDHPCKACGGTVFNVAAKSGECTNCKNKRRDASKTAQNRAECLSDAQNVKVYRKDCQGCIYANESVCCGGVR